MVSLFFVLMIDAHRTIDDEIQALSEKIHMMRDEQVYLVYRERTHAASKLIQNAHSLAAKSTFARIFWWSLLQIVLLVGTCLFQVYYLKRYDFIAHMRHQIL